MNHNRLQVTIGSYSDKGRKEINQDYLKSHIPNEPQLGMKGITLALADGISSSEVSQEASKTAVDTFLTDYFSTPDSWPVRKSAERVLTATSSWLYSQTRKSQYRYVLDKGYVCTIAVLILRSRSAYTLHAGDTRIYRIRSNRLEHLGEDHRLWISKEQSYLSRAMGMDSQLAIDYNSFELQIGDIFLLMTDGVYEHVDETTIVQTISENSNDLDTASKVIVEKAYENESGDNLSIQIVRVEALPSYDVEEIQQQLIQKPFPPVLEERSEFDGYKILRTLKTGSRSHVFLALDIQTNDHVVLKAPAIDVKVDMPFLERFLMEEWIARRINSANVMKSYQQTHTRNFVYTVTEYIEGQTLAQLMRDNPKSKLESVRNIAQQIAKGLSAFHRLEMIHQDIRPENIMIDSEGIVKIIDFGSTRVEGIHEVSLQPEEMKQMPGTALYLAPEYFIDGHITRRGDIFSLATIIYQMLSNELPYGVEVARCKNIMQQKKLRYKPLDCEGLKIPIWVDEAIKKALAVDPFDRYSEVSEFLYDLHHPNKAFLKRTKPPLMQRNPLLFWQTLSLTLLFLLILSLLK